jgi:hypothetical protein
LDRQIITEPIHNEAGKTVRFPIDPAIGAGGIEEFPETQGCLQSRAEPTAVEASQWGAADNAGGDQRLGVEIASSEKLATVILEVNQAARFRPWLTGRRGLKFVAENPFVAPKDPSFGPFSQFQGRR